MRRPSVKTSLPGPKAKAVIERAAQWGSLMGQPPWPIVPEVAEGSWVTDPDGNEFLDFVAAGGVCVTGHCHPRVVEAIRRQAAELIHYPTAQGYHSAHAALAERLSGLRAARGGSLRTLIGQSGSDAVRAAIDIARHHTGRDAVIAFVSGLEDPDLDGLSMPTNKLVQQSGLGPLVSGMHHASFPDPLRDGDEATSRALEDILIILGKVVSPDSVAALLIEPIQHEGGYRIPPHQFLAALRRLCDQHGILLVCNEIHTGMGRTGKMFGWQHAEITPDIVCLAGGMGGGLPLGAVIARGDLLDWPARSRPSTFGGNPLACAAALETLALVEGGLTDRAATVGETLLGQLQAALAEEPRVAEIRGRGLLIAVELVRDREGLEPDPDLRDALVRRCFERGLLLGASGPSSVAITPALTIDADEAAVGVEILAEALRELSLAVPASAEAEATEPFSIDDLIAGAQRSAAAQAAARVPAAAGRATPRKGKAPAKSKAAAPSKPPRKSKATGRGKAAGKSKRRS
jgi:4-aminobutyrate aminotransferase